MNFFKRILGFKEKQKKIEPANENKVSKKALCVGINDYPGSSNDLNGCVNDAKDWSELLKTRFAFDSVKILLDSQATASNVKLELQSLISNSKAGDIIVFTYSGHGTTVSDDNGDEEDRLDEAICCYDNIVRDDELRKIISTTPKGVKLTIISDSCHSGTITREFLIKENSISKAGRPAPKPRYMPSPMATRSKKAIRSETQFLSQENMIEILLTGCRNIEYSYDANIKGKFMGAMSSSAIEIIKANPATTWNEFYKELRKILPSKRFRQTPQLEGSSENKSKPLFT